MNEPSSAPTNLWRERRTTRGGASTCQSQGAEVLRLITMIMPKGEITSLNCSQPTGLLLIPQAIYEHAEPRWNDIGKGNVLIRPPDLSGNSTSSHLAAN
jgi:hypothetical protein